VWIVFVVLPNALLAVAISFVPDFLKHIRLVRLGSQRIIRPSLHGYSSGQSLN
jgi:hypothetical protein